MIPGKFLFMSTLIFSQALGSEKGPFVTEQPPYRIAQQNIQKKVFVFREINDTNQQNLISELTIPSKKVTPVLDQSTLYQEFMLIKTIVTKPSADETKKCQFPANVLITRNEVVLVHEQIVGEGESISYKLASEKAYAKLVYLTNNKIASKAKKGDQITLVLHKVTGVCQLKGNLSNGTKRVYLYKGD